MKPQVAIIGAGIAGLSATRSLFANGFTDIVIFEAASRIGGRINTGQFGKLVFTKFIFC